jgi:isopentenyl diphosphate isomerase/L-lactate dehydrogenase-like FMN-dependent dehydrogenase
VSLAQREYSERLSSPTATWEDLRQLRQLWPGQPLVKAVLIGRPWVWGLAARGQAGVELCLELFREDIERSMRLLGTPAVSAISPSHVALPQEWTR